MRSRLKLFLLALLILTICLFFSRKTKENFTTLTFSYPNGFMNHPDDITTGVLGSFAALGSIASFGGNNERFYQRFGMYGTDDGGFVRAIICQINNDNINISTTINSLKTACFDSGTPIKNLLFMFNFTNKNHITYFLVDGINDPTTSTYDGSTSFTYIPPNGINYYNVQGRILDGNDPYANDTMTRDGSFNDVEISYVYSSSCIVTGWSTYDECISSSGQKCTESGASGKKRKTRILIPAISGTECPNILSGTTFVVNNINCTLPECPPRDCELGPWRDSVCVPDPSPGSPTCEFPANSQSGTKIQTRTLVEGNSRGSCPDRTTQRSAPCSLQPCPPVNCVLGDYADDGGCTVPGGPCGNGIGTKTQIQPVIIPSQYGGTCNPGTRNVPCTVARGENCPDPITNDTIMKILASDYKDFSSTGLKPYNSGYLLSHKVFGKSIASTFEHMEDFKKIINRTSCG